MKYTFVLILLLFCQAFTIIVTAQDQPISPSLVITGVYLGETPPLRDLPAFTDAEWQQMVEKAEKNENNPGLATRSYPYAATALPEGPDPVWQREMGASRETRAPIVNFNGQDSPAFPPDANGTVGPNHYMQTINTVYAIYNKTGTLVAGPANMNTIFSGATGATCNDGDPLILYDEQAGRWLAVEFSICGANDYMLVAVSTTNDPTGTWYKYSFDVADMPDYEKFGIWQDGYYMGTNNSSGNDIYVFERSKMLLGQAAQAVAFNNSWRPTSIDGFMCVPPLDNDGTFAPSGEPGLFVAFNDDAIGGGSDQLWIYELSVNWTTPASSTFTLTQQINVASFDSNFGNTWDNISQQGTSQKLDAIPQVIMNPPQYRNLGTYETIVCCHTVDVDNTDHAGIRWYELRRVSSGNWNIRQQGTYAPDGHSRWMGSIMLNGKSQIGLGYSVSSSTIYPAIRYCGQSAAAYAAATGILDVPEEIIQAGISSQSGYNRWGDYSAMQVDPANDSTFWFTSEYIGSGGARKTKIASFNLGVMPLSANFTANNTTPLIYTTVNFSDLSTGGSMSWTWSMTPGTYIYVGGTTASSQNPQVQFTATGSYSITLTISDGSTNDSKTKTNYINAIDCINTAIPFSEDFSDGALPNCWTIIDHQVNGQVWQFNNPGGITVNTTTAANGFAILNSDHYGAGNSQNADLVTPALNLSAYATVNLTFQHYFLKYLSESATLSYSINGGSSWTVIQTWTTTTANAANFSQDMTAQVAGQSNVKFKWNYTGTWGYHWAVDDISITGSTTGVWTGTTSKDWSTASNWNNNTIPAGNVNITIPATAPYWPIYDGNLTLGVGCKNINMIGGNAQLNINGNLTIPLGYSLTMTGTALVRISGSLTNKGIFSQDAGSVEFNGNSTSAISVFGPADLIITNYSRAIITPGMISLTDSSPGPTGDDGYSNVTLPFPFNYAGTNYTQARISTNGWVSLNQTGTTTASNGNLFTTSNPNATLAPWFDDLSADGTGKVIYNTTGTTPNRVFAVEWKRVLCYKSSATARISFQLKLYETTNIIEFHYGTLEAGTHNGSESASIGIEDATGGNNHFIEATEGSNTTGISTLKSNLNWPMVNYRFTPPQLEATFNNMTVNNPGGLLNFNINTNINGNFNVMPGGSFNVSNGKTLKVNGTVMK